MLSQEPIRVTEVRHMGSRFRLSIGAYCVYIQAVLSTWISLPMPLNSLIQCTEITSYWKLTSLCNNTITIHWPTSTVGSLTKELVRMSWWTELPEMEALRLASATPCDESNPRYNCVGYLQLRSNISNWLFLQRSQAGWLVGYICETKSALLHAVGV